MGAEQEVVIVGSDGTEHIFPAGMDPLRASAVVREQEALAHPSTVKAVSASEPDTYAGGAWKGWKEGSEAGLRGFIKGVGPGLVDGVKETIKLPLTLAKGAVAAGIGGYHMVSDPAGTSKEAVDNIAGIPGKLATMAGDAATKARTNPEGFGNDVGRLTGAAEVGVAAAHVLPLTPKPIARKVGSVMDQVGTKGAWPIRMMGAHQLGSGNPMGLATLAMPEALQKSGQSLQVWGGEAPAVVRLGKPGVAKLNSAFDEAMVKRGMAFADEQAAAAPSGASLPGKIDKAVESGQLRRNGSAPTEPRPPFPGVRQSTYDPTPAEATAPSPAVRVLGKAASDLANGKAAPAPVLGPASTLDDLATKIGTGVNEEAAVNNLQLQTENSSRLANRNTRVPVSEGIPPSKSKSAMSSTPGLTRNDIIEAGGNPDMNYKNMPADVIERIKRNRASRHATNYANAQTDKSLRAGTNDMKSILEQSLLLRNMERLR